MPGTAPDLSNVRADNSALLIIDMSRDFLAPGAAFETAEGREMADHLIPLVDRCRETGLQVIYINHVHHPGAHDMGSLGDRFPLIRSGRVLRAGTSGVEIWPGLAPQEGDVIIEKIRQSAFYYTHLEACLRELKVQNVIIAGVSIGACVECTARDAVARDLNVIMLSDGTSASALPDLGWGDVDSATLSRVFLTNFAYHFGTVASIGELLEALGNESEP